MRRTKLAMLSALAPLGLAAPALAQAPAAPNPPDACSIRDLSSFNYVGNDCGAIWRLADKTGLPESGLSIIGWLNASYMANSQSPSTHFNGPVAYNDKDNGQFNQAYLSIAMSAPKNNSGWFFGGRVDALYGSDFLFTTAGGLDGTINGNTARSHNEHFTYGLAIPQLYAEIDYKDLQIKVGHFYTIIGHESVMAKANFFATHSYAFAYGEPATNSGILLSKPLNANWSLTGGLVNGWNQFRANDSDGGKNLNNFLGGVSYSNGRYGAAFNVQTGKDSDFNFAGVGPYANRTTLNAVATMNLTPRTNVLVEGLWGRQQQTLGFNALNSSEASWYGVNGQVVHALNNQWSLGGRLEWFDDPKGYLVTGLRPGNVDASFRLPGNFYEASVGANYKPMANLTLRGEVRYDTTNAIGYFAPGAPAAPPNGAFDDFAKKNQFLFGVDAIVQF